MALSYNSRRLCYERAGIDWNVLSYKKKNRNNRHQYLTSYWWNSLKVKKVKSDNFQSGRTGAVVKCNYTTEIIFESLFHNGDFDIPHSILRLSGSVFKESWKVNLKKRKNSDRRRRGQTSTKKSCINQLFFHCSCRVDFS